MVFHKFAMHIKHENDERTPFFGDLVPHKPIMKVFV